MKHKLSRKMTIKRFRKALKVIVDVIQELHQSFKSRCNLFQSDHSEGDSNFPRDLRSCNFLTYQLGFAYWISMKWSIFDRYW